MVEAPLQPRPHRAVGVGPIGKSLDLEPTAVVALEQTSHEMGRRMIVEIGREIGEANALPPPAEANKRRRGRKLGRGEETRALELRRWRQRVAQKGKRR